MSGLRVALLNPCFWPEVRRGSERFARELADGLIARGHRPSLLTSHPGPPSTRVEDGLEVIRAWRPPEGRLLRRGYPRHLTHVPFSYRALRRGDYALAHALHPADAMAATRWARASGRPAVFSLMGIASRPMLVARRGFLDTMRAACEGSSAVVTLSAAAADGARRWLGVETRVIAPGVDLGAFAPGGERAEAPTIVCAAALSEPRKRAGLLLDAFARVRRERPGARLVLSRPADPREASAFAERDGVELADLDDTAALAGAYRSAWVSALPATGEAFGLVLAEALACGTPAVGTGDGGIPEVLDGPLTGRVVAPGGDDEPERFARALLEGFELAADPSAAAACRERAQAFSAERCTDAYVALYEELLDA